MGLFVTSRRDVLTSLADEILHNYGRGRTMVAVDGRGDERTGEFADSLADIFRFIGHTAFRASMRDFHNPRIAADGHGRDAPESLYRDTFDYSLFRRVLTDPYRMGGSAGFVTAGFDQQRDAPIEPKWMTGPEDAVLIVDGLFLNRPELRGLWHYSIFLERPDVQTVPVVDDRQRGALALYDAEAKPREAATAIIDNREPEHPSRVFADSC